MEPSKRAKAGKGTEAAAAGELAEERRLRRTAEEGYRELKDEADRLREQVLGHQRALAELHGRLGELVSRLGSLGAGQAPRPPEAAAPAPAAAAHSGRQRSPGQGDGPSVSKTAGLHELNGQGLGSDAVLDKCQRAILTVLVQQKKPLPKARLALMAGYSAKSGGFNNALSKLRTHAWVDGRGLIGATTLGAKAVGRVPPLPAGPELFAYWVHHARVDKCGRAILTALRESGSVTSKAELARLSGYSASSGGFNNALSKLRTLGLIEGRGDLTLMADLQD